MGAYSAAYGGWARFDRLSESAGLWSWLDGGLAWGFLYGRPRKARSTYSISVQRDETGARLLGLEKLAQRCRWLARYFLDVWGDGR